MPALYRSRRSGFVRQTAFDSAPRSDSSSDSRKPLRRAPASTSPIVRTYCTAQLFSATYELRSLIRTAGARSSAVSAIDLCQPQRRFRSRQTRISAAGVEPNQSEHDRPGLARPKCTGQTVVSPNVRFLPLFRSVVTTWCAENQVRKLQLLVARSSAVTRRATRRSSPVHDLRAWVWITRIVNVAVLAQPHRESISPVEPTICGAASCNS